MLFCLYAANAEHTQPHIHTDLTHSDEESSLTQRAIPGVINSPHPCLTVLLALWHTEQSSRSSPAPLLCLPGTLIINSTFPCVIVEDGPKSTLTSTLLRLFIITPLQQLTPPSRPPCRQTPGEYLTLGPVSPGTCKAAGSVILLYFTVTRMKQPGKMNTQQY